MTCWDSVDSGSLWAKPTTKATHVPAKSSRQSSSEERLWKTGLRASRSVDSTSRDLGLKYLSGSVWVLVVYAGIMCQLVGTASRSESHPASPVIRSSSFSTSHMRTDQPLFFLQPLSSKGRLLSCTTATFPAGGSAAPPSVLSELFDPRASKSEPPVCCEASLCFFKEASRPWRRPLKIQPLFCSRISRVHHAASVT